MLGTFIWFLQASHRTSSCRLHVGPLTLPETLTVMVKALYQGAWGEDEDLKGITEADIRELLSHRCLLDSMAELSGIPRSLQWAYRVLGDPDIMAKIAQKYEGFDVQVASRVREGVGNRVSNLVIQKKSWPSAEATWP